MLRLYLRVEVGMAEDTEVATLAGTVVMAVTQVATEEDILEVIPTASMDESQAAQRRAAIS